METLDRVRAIVGRQTGLGAAEAVDPDRSFEDMALDSLDRLELVMFMEEEFDIDITDEEVDNPELSTPRALAAFIDTKLPREGIMDGVEVVVHNELPEGPTPEIGAACDVIVDEEAQAALASCLIGAMAITNINTTPDSMARGILLGLASAGYQVTREPVSRVEGDGDT